MKEAIQQWHIKYLKAKKADDKMQILQHGGQWQVLNPFGNGFTSRAWA
jgi:hypothetical protein